MLSEEDYDDVEDATKWPVLNNNKFAKRFDHGTILLREVRRAARLNAGQRGSLSRALTRYWFTTTDNEISKKLQLAEWAWKFYPSQERSRGVSQETRAASKEETSLVFRPCQSIIQKTTQSLSLSAAVRALDSRLRSFRGTQLIQATTVCNIYTN